MRGHAVPTLENLSRYAEAVGRRLEVELVNPDQPTELPEIIQNLGKLSPEALAGLSTFLGAIESSITPEAVRPSMARFQSLSERHQDLIIRLVNTIEHLEDREAILEVLLDVGEARAKMPPIPKA